jgi:RND family efflux transporter MFP subunit
MAPTASDVSQLGQLGRRRLRLVATAAFAILVVAIIAIGVRLFLAARTVASETAESALPYVAVATPEPAGGNQRLELPATLSPVQESPIYARTSGYLAKLHADIGQRVRAGELLAEIDTPEVDQQLAQAAAELEQVKASRSLAQLAAERFRELRGRRLVSQQDYDEKQAALAQLDANVRAARANLARLRELQGFKHVTAPFSGVITARNVDVGTLIDAGGSASNRQIFNLAKTDPLRVFVNVPQSDAPSIHDGQPATLELAELAGRAVAGQVARSAGAIDPKARTLLTEIDIPNHDGALLPGAYGRILIDVPGRTNGLRVPAVSLLFRADGPHVAVVRADSTIELRAITIGRNNGAKVDVLTGLSAGDRVVLNPGDALEQGMRVKVR